MTEKVYQKKLKKKLEKWQKRKARRLKEEWQEAALLLMRIELEILRPELEKLYSKSPRGRKPYDPVCMIRALLLMTILQYKSIPEFASELRHQPRLAIIAGFEPFKSPATATFYLFIDRLEDGNYQPSCQHRIKASEMRKGKHLRNLKVEKANKEEEKKKILSQCDSITEQLKNELLSKTDQPRPLDFQKLLEDIFVKTAIIPSAKRGLLGNLKQLIISGDGSALPTGASCYGRATCNCRKEGIYKCDHDRLYTDGTANWGYDSYRECYYFGHTFYQHCVSINGHDLPLHILISQASETDFTLSLKSLDRFVKACSENNLDISIYAASYDSGHDAMGNYQYLIDKSINPVICLNHRKGQHPKPTGNAEKINAQGIPICPAGLAMRKHSKGSHHRFYFNCPVKRPTFHLGKTIWHSAVENCPLNVLCQPDSKMGPIVYIRSDQDPRYYPSIARDSSEYKKIMNLRTGCERSNSAKKVTYKLGLRPCRSDTHFLFRLFLISIIEHAKAWLAVDRTLAGNHWKNLLVIPDFPPLAQSA